MSDRRPRLVADNLLANAFILRSVTGLSDLASTSVLHEQWQVNVCQSRTLYNPSFLLLNMRRRVNGEYDAVSLGLVRFSFAFTCNKMSA